VTKTFLFLKIGHTIPVFFKLPEIVYSIEISSLVIREMYSIDTPDRKAIYQDIRLHGIILLFFWTIDLAILAKTEFDKTR